MANNYESVSMQRFADGTSIEKQPRRTMQIRLFCQSAFREPTRLEINMKLC